MEGSTPGSTSDIISHLPGNIIENILMCLPIQDVVRTSVLSRKWRYIWVKLPQLVFDDSFCRQSITTVKHKLMMTIYQVLLRHRGPVLKFTLSLSGLESCPEIDQLILFVADSGIQEFTLHIWQGEPYKLPSSLFSCHQLKHLNLSSCVLKLPPGFEGFSRLLCLEVCKVDITADLFSSLISSCPLLERLKLEGSSFDYLEIIAPNLRFLCCKGLFRSIFLKNTPHLATVSIYLSGIMNEGAYEEVFKEGETSNSVMLFGGLPVIEVLVLDYYYVKAFICETDESDAIDPVLELLEVEGWSDVSLNHLRVVEMQKLSGTKSELEFIKLLLAKSPMLVSMLIELNSEKVADGGLSILKELTRFRRASPQAEIVFDKFR